MHSEGKNMELLQLRYFLDAAKCENFSAVAKKYLLPPSSVSHTISKLEEELGVKLFTRDKNKLSLNAYGHIFLSHIEPAIRQINLGIEHLADITQDNIYIILREGSIPIISLVAKFKESHPKINVTIAKLSDVANGIAPADVCIRALPCKEQELFHWEPLFTEKILVAVPAASQLAKKSALTIDNIRDVPVIGLYSGSKMYRQISAYFELNSYAPNICTESENHAMVAEFVKNGFGIAFFPEISWSAVQSDGIVSLPFADYDAKRTIYIGHPKNRKPSDATLEFIRYAKAHFAYLK